MTAIMVIIAIVITNSFTAIIMTAFLTVIISFQSVSKHVCHGNVHERMPLSGGSSSSTEVPWQAGGGQPHGCKWSSSAEKKAPF